MTYRIEGLDPAPFQHYFEMTPNELTESGAVMMIADAPTGFPCRVSLADAPTGTRLLLINHVSHRGGPFHASHAIFVAEAAERAVVIDRVPTALDSRALSLRAFDEDGMMQIAELAPPGEADAAVRRLLADPRVHHVDAHNALRGCFAARIDRV